jgi:predicted helicase
VRLLQTGLIGAEDLIRKYSSELHANEIVLLAYYIAAINIEAAYHGVRGGQYEPVGGIVLTDTFQITEPGDTMDAEIFPQNNDRILWLVKQQRHFVHLRCTSTEGVEMQKRLTRHTCLL